MKVIHILVELKFSGAEIMYVDAAPVFQEKGCELTVMSTAYQLGEYASYFEKAGYKIMHWPLPSLKNYPSRVKYYINFIKLIKKEKYDVIHIHSLWAMWGLALCAWLTNVRSVFTFHNVYPTRSFTYPYHCLLRWSAKHIFKCRFQTISDSVYNHELNFYHNKTTKIYNWYGINRYFPATDEEKANARNDLAISSSSFVLISVGGCSPIKRHTDIIKALPYILEKFPNCLYLHLGKGVSETEEMELAKKLGVIDKIRFCSNQENVRKYLISSDVYLMPSRFEGIPITTIEAMACQIPAILYDVPGLRDFNKNEETSILIPEDYNVLAEKVLFVKNNPLLSNAMALRAKNHVNNTYNMKDNANKIFELYK